MKIPYPEKLTTIITRKAEQRAREKARQRGWKSAPKIKGIPAEGEVRLNVPRFLMFQELGTKEFDMVALEGKTIPLPQGPRRAVGVGQPGYVTLPGGVRVWRERKWHHPGIKPTNLLHDSIKEVVDEMEPQIDEYLRNYVGLGVFKNDR